MLIAYIESEVKTMAFEVILIAIGVADIFWWLRK
jgi:hypothetical protein